MGNLDIDTWEKFRDTGMLWFVNRILHVLGWCLVLVESEDGKVRGAYPARTTYQGFTPEDEEHGFQRVRKFLKEEHSCPYHGTECPSNCGGGKV